MGLQEINLMKKPMKEFVILIADEDEGICNSLSGICEDEGYKVLTADSYDKAIRALKLQAPSLILLDSWLSGIDGVSILKDIKSFNKDIPVILFLEPSTIEFAVQATRAGIYDLFEKPLSLEKVLLVIKRVFKEKT